MISYHILLYYIIIQVTTISYWSKNEIKPVCRIKPRASPRLPPSRRAMPARACRKARELVERTKRGTS